MSRALAGRVAVVTGGASGIGEAIVRRFAAEGAIVAILDRDAAAARRVAPTVGGPDVMAIGCDVSAEADVAAAIEAVAQRHKQIDVLVNNAGISATIAPIEELAESAWDEMMDIHAKGCFLCSKHDVRHMTRQRRGVIVNISSLGVVRGRPLRHSYIAAKHAIVGLTKSMALEGIADNIRVNAIAPGPVATARKGPEPGAEELGRRLEEHRALGGSEISFMIRPDAVASAALFLASDEATNITGIVLPVDGGIMAGSLERGTLRFPAR
jgi:NAD(P)-dependent dehydrogenase (short-subunit alcohol dehydrogenase family)